MDERRGSAWFGLPSMIGLLALVAFGSAVHGLVGALVGLLAVLIVFLVIGAVLTMTKKR